MGLGPTIVHCPASVYQGILLFMKTSRLFLVDSYQAIQGCEALSTPYFISAKSISIRRPWSQAPSI